MPAADDSPNADGGERLSPAELGGLLGQVDELAQRLMTSLAEIRTALTSANSAELMRILEKESAILARLDDLGRPPISAAGAGGVQGIEAQIRQVEPEGGPLFQRWQSLRATLQRCNAINRANAAAVAAMEQRVRLAISLLRQGPPEALAYGPAGAALRSDTRRRVTRA